MDRELAQSQCLRRRALERSLRHEEAARYPLARGDGGGPCPRDGAYLRGPDNARHPTRLAARHVHAAIHIRPLGPGRFALRALDCLQLSFAGRDHPSASRPAYGSPRR